MEEQAIDGWEIRFQLFCTAPPPALRKFQPRLSLSAHVCQTEPSRLHVTTLTVRAHSSIFSNCNKSHCHIRYFAYLQYLFAVAVITDHRSAAIQSRVAHMARHQALVQVAPQPVSQNVMHHYLQ